MRRLLSVILVLLAMFFLVACGGDSDNTTTTTTDTTANESNTATTETGFTATLTGAVETELTGRGYFQCEEGLDEYTIGANSGLSNNILIIVTREATAGSTYEIVTERMQPEQASAMYIGEDMQTSAYDEDVSGTITLDAVPSQAGDRVAGNFEFTASTGEDATTNFVGTFDFLAGENAFFNCNGGE